MQLVLHAPFGSRINKAWGLALRKRFCRQFNFELQAAATEDALLLSLGPQHSFPLADVFRYLHPETARDVLVQAFLDAPVFETRWRWNTTISLAVPRARGGRKVPPQLQRMLADDLMAAVFPDAAACLENIPGDREIPDHPLVNQTVRDCLEEAMDFDGLRAVLERIHRGELRLVARDTPEPSLFAHEILNARPYAFLDDAPLEERRSHAVQTRRAGDRATADDLGGLDAAAIERVRDEARPDPRDADELHDALLTAGFLTGDELDGADPDLLATLTAARRAGDRRAVGGRRRARVVASPPERLPELRAIHPERDAPPSLQPPPSRRRGVDARRGDRRRAARPADARRARPPPPRWPSRSASPPATPTRRCCRSKAKAWSCAAGSRPGAAGARMVRPRAARPHPPLHAEPAARRDRAGQPGRVHAVPLPLAARRAGDQADRARRAARDRRAARRLRARRRGVGARGAAGAAGPLRAGDARHALPDGRGGLGAAVADAGRRRTAARLVAATPIALFLREHARAWRALRPAGDEPVLTDDARAVLIGAAGARGVVLPRSRSPPADSTPSSCRHALGELAASGLVASDGFAGLRALVWAARGRPVPHDRRRSLAGRWTAFGRRAVGRRRRAKRRSSCRPGRCCAATASSSAGCSPARPTPRRGASWRVSTAGSKRAARSAAAGSSPACRASSSRCRTRWTSCARCGARRPTAAWSTISAADPLNLAGIVTAGERVRAASRHRIVYRDGTPLAVADGDGLRELTPLDPSLAADVARALKVRPATAVALR